MAIKSSKLLAATRGVAGSRHSFLAAIGVATISLFALNVHAEDAAPQRTINFTGMDLSKQADAKALYTRLEYAARSVCGKFEGKELRQVTQQRACYEQALSDAVASVNHANVTALYRSDAPLIRVAQRGDSQRRS